MSIDYTGAIEYFKTENHPRGAVWNGFGETRQKAAIAQARRVLSRALGRVLDDDEEAYAEGDTTREEYAVYEQALWMLENGVIANGEQSAPGFIAADPQQEDRARDAKTALFSPEALRWLGRSGGSVVLMRG